MERYLMIFSIFTIKLLKFNKNEKDFLFFLKKIKKEGILLDIGANIGVMTYYLAKYNPSSTVYSFEPLPINLINLQKIIKIYNLQNVIACDYALGNFTGDAEIIMPIVDNVRMHGLSHIVHHSIEELNEGQRHIIKVQELDKLKFLEDTDKKIVAIKIDVENFEYFVLLGGKNLIEKHKPLIYCELWKNKNRQKCFDLMKTLNYQTKIFNGKTLLTFNSSSHNTQNFFFVPNEN